MQGCARGGRRLAAFRQRIPGVLLAALLAASGTAGCQRYGRMAAEEADTVSVRIPRPARPADLEADLFLYRITRLKTGERLGVGRTFEMEPDRQVRAVLHLAGLEPTDDVLLHLLWLNPDGKEAYTKRIYITPEDWTVPARRDSLADDLLWLDPRAGTLELESRYGVDPIRVEEELYRPPEKRLFKAGTWQVRAYLFRKLLLETSFDLLPEG